MKMINLNLNTAVLTGTKEDAVRCCKECFDVLKAAKDIVDALKPPEKSADMELYSDLQIVGCENLLDSLDTPAIDLYLLAGLSRIAVLYDRLRIFQSVREQLKPVLEQIVMAYVELTEEEKETVQSLSVSLLEQLSFFVYYEFTFDQTLHSIQDDREWEVNEAILEYAGKESLDLKQVITFLLEIYQEYRPTIPSFDFTEEELDGFYYYTGTCAMSLLDNIDMLEPKIAHQLARGEISPEEVLRRIQEEREQMEEEEERKEKGTLRNRKGEVKPLGIFG